MMFPKISILNDFPPNVGVTTYTYNIYLNLKYHDINVYYYQFLADEKYKNISKDIIIKNGIDFKIKYNLLLNQLLHLNTKAFKNIDSDIIIFSCYTLSPLIKHYRDKKTIMIIYDLYSFYYHGKSRFLDRRTKKFYKLQTSTDLIISDSNYVKNDIIKWLNVPSEKIYVVYPAINEKIFYPGKGNMRYKLGLSDDDFVLLNVAFDTPNKNVTTVLKVLKKLPENFKLIRVGHNLSSLKLIKELNLDRRVIILEDIDSKMLGDIYRSSDLFLYPSYFEGFGIPVLEAMASGIPVITSNRTSLPEVVGEAGILTDPFDVDEIVSNIINIYKNKEDYNFLKEKGLLQAKKFSFENQYNSLIEVLKNLMNK